MLELGRTPDSVRVRHLSLPEYRQAAPGLLVVTQPHCCRCDVSERGSRDVTVSITATNEPTPHTLLSLSQRSRLAAAVASDAGGRLPHRFTPHPHHIASCETLAVGGWCLLLPSCVTAGLRPRCPRLLFRGVTWPLRRPESREVPLGVYPSDGTPCSSYVVKVWSGRRDSNPRPSPWQGDALPTEPLPHPCQIVPRTMRLVKNFSCTPFSEGAYQSLVTPAGFEPAVFTLRG